MHSTSQSALWPPGSNVMSNHARSLTTNSPRPATTRSAPITRCQVGRKGPRALVLGVYRPLGAGSAVGPVVWLDRRCGLRGVGPFRRLAPERFFASIPPHSLLPSFLSSTFTLPAPPFLLSSSFLDIVF